LDLSPNQTAALTKINTELQRKKIEMGNFIVTNETKLDGLFQSKKVTRATSCFTPTAAACTMARIEERHFNGGLQHL
jgi:hypothetical protein